MILDKQNLLSDAQSLTGAAGNYLSTNTIDLGAAGTSPLLGTVPRDIGKGEPVDLLVQCLDTFAGGTSVEAQVVQADDAALTTNLQVLQSSGAIALASLVPGYQFRVPFVPHGVTKRYLGVRFVTVGTFTGGGGNRVTAGVVVDRQSTHVTN